MITPNPLVGTGLHSLGGISASACYLPYHKTKNWSWVPFWLVQAFFAWILVPLVLAFATVPDLVGVLRDAPQDVVLKAFSLGALYGFGGLSFGFAIRCIGYSLTFTLSIGLSAILGTLIPLLLKGGVVAYFSRPGGDMILSGMIISILGVLLCGWAGFKKEKSLGDTTHFNMRKGLALTLIAGVLSAVFNISLEVGQPIADLAAARGAGHFEGNAKLIVSTAGCFVVNLVWFVVLGLKQNTLREFTFRTGLGARDLLRNYCWSGLAGTLWCMQFFFYGLGHVKMGSFQFASWVIHMSMLIFFSYMVGVLMKEWKNVSRNTYLTLLLALLVLLTSFVVMTYGSVIGEAAMSH
jgi:L-rhamnose-H+ transport protein